jgi:hypothetical protein
MDDETRAALALFNRRLVQQADTERAQRRIDKALRAKDDAAARVRALEADTRAGATQRAEATAAYHAAVAAWDRARRGEPDLVSEPEPADAPEPAAPVEPAAAEAADAAAEPADAAEAPSG